MLFIDLDGFKPVNDTYGHDIGDALLVEVGRRLVAALPEAKQVARLGGDEFGVLIDVAQEDEAHVAASRRIIQAFSEPVRLGQISVRIALTIGLAIGPEKDVSADDLIRAADLAMYERKRGSRFSRPDRAA
ncbi:MAG: GGDEF domain-containing protein [Bauldia sp.]